MNVSQRLIKWYEVNKRILPWRERLNPYHIWLSEIILQQTRVSQGTKYYLKFIKKFPDVKILAASSIEEILVLWQGLGYYTRARNMHEAAKIIVEKYHGEFPEEYETIRQLPGIGNYTAAAISSLAFNLPYPAVDGNVYRVLARFFGIYTPIHTSLAKNDFYKAAMEIMDRKQPGTHNQALIELGALICLPRNPRCNDCPILDACFAYQKNAIQELPVKSKSISTKSRYFYYLVIRKNQKLYIQQRNQNDIWALLYEFPMIEMNRKCSIPLLLKSRKWKRIFQTTSPELTKISGEYIHKLSHQTLHAWFLEINTVEVLPIEAIQVTKEELNKFPFPRLINRYLSEEG